MIFKQVAFNGSRFAICFNGLYTPGTQNDCILMSGGTADRGGLAVFRKDIPTGSGIHKLLPNLGNAGKCVNILRLKNSRQTHVRVRHCYLMYNCDLPCLFRYSKPKQGGLYWSFTKFTLSFFHGLSLDWTNWTWQLWFTSNFGNKDISRVPKCWYGKYIYQQKKSVIQN